MSSIAYRRDIDGLRAIAVLPVLFFHTDFRAFEGGYVGIEVFFVVSGFLITRLIVNEISTTNSFRYGNFYARRVRRLFPALLFTLAITFLFSALLFSPDGFSRISGVVISRSDKPL